MMLLSLLNTKSPVEKFLLGAVELQTRDRGGVLSLVQVCILHELAVAAKKYREGKLNNPEVPLLHIQEKYNLERYTVSRNAIQLGEGGVQRRDRKGKPIESRGRGWIKSADAKDTTDARVKAVSLTKQGQSAMMVMFPDWFN